jgi:predicted Zn-dependent protease
MVKCIVLTKKDLYDSETAFVFGLTEINGDISLVSTYHFPSEDPKSKLRQLKILTHEFGHTLGIEHCTSHKCILGGIMSFEELDSHPLLPCLEDCAKIAFACGRTLRQQLQSIITACNELQLENEIPHEYDRILRAIELLPE